MINFNSPAFVLEAVQLLGIIMKEIVNSTMDKRTKLKHLKDKCAGYGFKYQDISKDLKELTVSFYCRNVESKATIKTSDKGTTISLDIEEEMYAPRR